MSIPVNDPFPIPQFPANVERAGLAAAFPTIDRLFEQLQQGRQMPAVAYGVVIDGELAHSGAAGLAHVAEGRAVMVDSVFRIASMTKSFTAMAILNLRDEGHLRLDRPAAEYIPELAHLKGPTRDSARITVHDLLTMGSGFPQDDPWADRQLAISEQDFSALLGQEGAFLYSNPPNSTFEYSNLSYAMLGRIVSNVAGIRYQQYIERLILAPLGMTSTTFDRDKVDPARLAMGYQRIDGEWQPVPPLADGAFAAIGGMFTTIPDFARYMALLLSAYPARDDAESGPVRRSTAREMQAVQRSWGALAYRPTPADPLIVRTRGYGYGLNPMADSQLGYSVSHGGGLPGYGTYYRLLPEHGVGIVAFSNLTYGGTEYSVPGMDARIQEGLLALKQTGQLRPRTYPVSAALQTAQARFVDAYAHCETPWDEARMPELLQVFTETFFMDSSAERRQTALARIYTELGPCHDVRPVEPENALRGRWRMICARGTLEVFVTLAPTAPPRIQYWTLTPAKPLSARMMRAVRGFVRLVNDFEEARVRKVTAYPLTLDWVADQCAALQVQYGQMWVGNVLEGDGDTRARVRLEGAKGSIDAVFALDSRGLVRALTFAKPHEFDFVP
jgi:CubicO group peptidase (beta-lactamase class C family)